MTHLTPTWTGNLSDLDADQLAARATALGEQIADAHHWYLPQSQTYVTRTSGGLAPWVQARVDVLNEMKRRASGKFALVDLDCPECRTPMHSGTCGGRRG